MQTVLVILPQILADYNIAVVPVTVIVGEQAFTDGEDIQPDDIFQYVDGEGKHAGLLPLMFTSTILISRNYNHETAYSICLSGFPHVIKMPFSGTRITRCLYYRFKNLSVVLTVYWKRH